MKSRVTKPLSALDEWFESGKITADECADLLEWVVAHVDLWEKPNGALMASVVDDPSGSEKAIRIYVLPPKEAP